VHDPAHTRCVIREGLNEVVVSSLDALPKTLNKYNKRSSEPLVVTLEGKWGVQMTIIDTPPLRTVFDLARWASNPAPNRYDDFYFNSFYNPLAARLVISLLSRSIEITWNSFFNTTYL